ncbi:MAG TPA: ribosome small subunit-dependent GTPase A [Psychrobacter sp.]|uniref:Small ribosomal subunit biogenesis GTPase RsgA n=1 Tax=Psychrobacter pasteurii TaxID=1945520 RepID=A0A1R4EGA3_9GAMM|nr:ribosome small subunit-dependent GTPase A [Psychrobacter pasteurii]SJM37504.1 Putative ribosome biogenesis GTPase RsgA [Psychrobacter pasteurii]HAO60214.1 ribosome small subunit-dependent GTPase A [Psychrobacter sp.]
MALIRQRKLTKQQLRRIDKQQAQQQESIDGSLMDGVVMAHYGKQLEVQVTSLPAIIPNPPVVAEGEPEPFWQAIELGDIWRCHVRTNLPMLATGDKVRWVADPNTGFGRIESVQPRTSLVSRPDRYHKLKPVAANVDILAIVFAPLPAAAPNLIDRYLVVCHHADVKPLLVLNKADLLAIEDYAFTKNLLNEYQSLGYEAVLTAAPCPENILLNPTQSNSKQAIDSAKLTDIEPLQQQAELGLTDLQQQIKDKLVIFAGQSGVGKSTLVNALLPNSDQSVNVISTNSKLGQHTTTTSRLLPFNPEDLTQGGIVDTPGIREYGIWHLTPDDIIAGFVELYPLAGDCQFRDCKHTHNSKGCALWEAVAEGKVMQRRVESLVTLQAEADTPTY